MGSQLGRYTVLTVLAFAVGCGSDEESEPAKKPAEKPAPQALVGTYTTTLKPSDLGSNPAPELSGSRKWTLKIANSGGQNNGRAFTIVSPANGTLESSAFGVRGDLVLLHREECGADGKLHENEYRYKLEGSTLTLTMVKNRCSDRVAETILTSEPWTKAG